jgi:uncharacterized cupredoxin-like copper-binding protein
VQESNHLEMANQWLHHEMNSFDLKHHFGVDQSTKVDPELYQVIKIDVEQKNVSKSSSPYSVSFSQKLSI